MERIPTRTTSKGPADWFTGDVTSTRLPRVRARHRQASPACTSHRAPTAPWHHHTIGQTLYVTEGVGYVQARGGPLITIRPGEVIRVAGGEEHWNGGASSNFMTHIAITEGDTVWVHRLTDDEYPASRDQQRHF